MKTLSITTAAMVLMLASFTSQATPIKASYTVNLNDTDPGLVVHYSDVANNPFYADLNPGESVSGDLFRIWTDETNINTDDQNAKPIGVTFNFSMPDIFSGSVNGTTVGGTICFILCGDYGKVSWDDPADIYFGPGDSGHINIALSDEYFGLSPIGIGGNLLGATVHGTLTLVSDATPVPEPAELAILAFGLVLIGSAVGVRRRLSGRN